MCQPKGKFAAADLVLATQAFINNNPQLSASPEAERFLNENQAAMTMTMRQPLFHFRLSLRDSHGFRRAAFFTLSFAGPQRSKGLAVYILNSIANL